MKEEFKGVMNILAACFYLCYDPKNSDFPKAVS